MRILLGILCLAVLAGCDQAPPVNTPEIAGKFSKACLPEAIAMQAELSKVGIKSRVLRIGWAGLINGHVVTVYEYKGQVWAWDSVWASFPLKGVKITEPGSMALAWTNYIYPDRDVIAAKFLD